MPDLQERCVHFLSTLTDPLERARVGMMLFGKRYMLDIAPLCPPFEYDED